MNKFIVISVVIVAVLAALGVTGYFYYKNVFLRHDEKFIIDFVRKYPEKASLRIVRNDSVEVDFHTNRPMPLASTVKIILAVEFARQVADQKIEPEERIPLEDLSLFYIPNTDGGAHPAWLKYLNENSFTEHNSVSLRNVAKGMITFSSNANTEYLMSRLGLENINRNFVILNFKHHEKIYPFISALYLFRNEKEFPSQQFYDMMKKMSMTEYTEEALNIHRRLKNDRDSSLRKTFVMPGLELQRIWSDRLPRSTTREYSDLLKTITSKTSFPASMQKELDVLLEWPMEMNPKNKELYQYLGGKGGSTAFALTYALYARDHEGNTTEIVTFFDDLALMEGQRLRAALSSFQRNILSNGEFRREARETVALLR
ncbi:MAG: serine hydrolase [Ignavibacteriales bacterium]|nr:serine hydrolase [Ignavibacteriales bacterium]